MKLKKLIKKLEKIAKERGDNIEVVMADNISITNPVFSRKYPNKQKVIITDKKLTS